MNEQKVFLVQEVIIGDKYKGDKILFDTMTEMNDAFNEIDLGKDIFVQDNNGIITRLLNRMINTKINNGEIQMCAKGE
jgi:hypothetical protein